MSTNNNSDGRRRAFESMYFTGFFLGRPASLWRKALSESRRRDGRSTND